LTGSSSSPLRAALHSSSHARLFLSANRVASPPPNNVMLSSNGTPITASTTGGGAAAAIVRSLSPHHINHINATSPVMASISPRSPHQMPLSPNNSNNNHVASGGVGGGHAPVSPKSPHSTMLLAASAIIASPAITLATHPLSPLNQSMPIAATTLSSIGTVGGVGVGPSVSTAFVGQASGSSSQSPVHVSHLRRNSSPITMLTSSPSLDNDPVAATVDASSSLSPNHTNESLNHHNLNIVTSVDGNGNGNGGPSSPSSTTSPSSLLSRRRHERARSVPSRFRNTLSSGVPTLTHKLSSRAIAAAAAVASSSSPTPNTTSSEGESSNERHIQTGVSSHQHHNDTLLDDTVDGDPVDANMVDGVSSSSSSPLVLPPSLLPFVASVDASRGSMSLTHNGSSTLQSPNASLMVHAMHEQYQRQLLQQLRAQASIMQTAINGMTQQAAAMAAVAASPTGAVASSISASPSHTLRSPLSSVSKALDISDSNKSTSDSTNNNNNNERKAFPDELTIEQVKVERMLQQAATTSSSHDTTSSPSIMTSHPPLSLSSTSVSPSPSPSSLSSVTNDYFATLQNQLRLQMASAQLQAQEHATALQRLGLPNSNNVSINTNTLPLSNQISLLTSPQQHHQPTSSPAADISALVTLLANNSASLQHQQLQLQQQAHSSSSPSSLSSSLTSLLTQLAAATTPVTGFATPSLLQSLQTRSNTNIRASTSASMASGGVGTGGVGVGGHMVSPFRDSSLFALPQDSSSLPSNNGMRMPTGMGMGMMSGGIGMISNTEASPLPPSSSPLAPLFESSTLSLGNIGNSSHMSGMGMGMAGMDDLFLLPSPSPLPSTSLLSNNNTVNDMSDAINIDDD
jgi:hypothetical protein